jgi:hypothetical protein
VAQRHSAAKNWIRLWPGYSLGKWVYPLPGRTPYAEIGLEFEALVMADGEGKVPGYKSESMGNQELRGSAIDRIASACDTNAATKVNNESWYKAIVKNRRRMDIFHERLLKD